MGNKLTRATAVGAGHQLLCLPRFSVGVLVSQAEVTVVVGNDASIGALLSCPEEQENIIKEYFDRDEVRCEGCVLRLWLSEL